jgi:L,D-transpeptidase ErfK/SrfK
MFAVIYAMFIALVFFISQSANAEGVPIGRKLCQNNPNLICYTVKKNDTWQKLYPDFAKRDLVMRINRTNNALHPGVKIAIPKDITTANVMDYAPFSKTINPPRRKVIIVSIDPNILAWGAYNAAGTLEAWGPVSAGKGWCPDIHRGCHTAKGTFVIYQKQGAGCVSTKFPVGRGGAPMPYCMFFHGGFALHGSYDVPGYNASHGCVRLLVPDAKWLNTQFVMDEHVAVIVQ